MEKEKHLDLRADRPRKNYLAFRCHICGGRNWNWSYKMVDSYTRNRKIINPVLGNDETEITTWQEFAKDTWLNSFPDPTNLTHKERTEIFDQMFKAYCLGLKNGKENKNA